MEPKADRPRGPRLENSDKSDLPGIENEGVDDPALCAHTQRRSQSSKHRQVGLVKCLCPVAFKLGFGRKPSDKAEYNSQFGWSDCVNQFNLKTKQIKHQQQNHL